MSQNRTLDRIFYIRTIVSVVLYALFIIFSVSAVLTGTLQEQPFLLGGLLIGSVVILPRTSRRPDDDEDATQEQVEKMRDVRKWLTWARGAYFLIAVLLWFVLPEIV